MTNGIVNGTTGLESQFGDSLLLFILPSFSSIFFLIFSASLGLTKSAYVPPHLRNSQRAAPPPTITNGYMKLFFKHQFTISDHHIISPQERLERFSHRYSCIFPRWLRAPRRRFCWKQRRFLQRLSWSRRRRGLGRTLPRPELAIYPPRVPASRDFRLRHLEGWQTRRRRP